LKLSIFLVILLMCALGCSKPAHMALDPTVGDEIQSISIVSVIEQEQAGIVVRRAKEGGALFGLLGAIVDAGVTEGRVSEAEELSEQLQVASGELDFRGMFWSSLDSLFASSTWPASFTLDERTTPFDDAQLRRFLSESKADATLMLDTEYYLTPSVTILVIRTHAEGYLHDPEEKIYFGDYTYLSDSVAKGDSDPSKKAAMALWTHNDAETFFGEVSEGIAENIRMLQHDLVNRGRDSEETGQWVSLEYEDPYGEGDTRKTKAMLLGTIDGRAFLRGTKGNLFSMPEEWLVVLKQEEGP